MVAGRPNRKPANGRVRPTGDVERLALYLIFGEASRFSMPKHTLTGNIKRHRAFPSKIGVEWGVDESAERLIKECLIEPLIIVAVANTGEERIHEYAPTRGVFEAQAKRKKRSKGLARKYGHFLMDELKPYIDRKYRTNPGAECTGLGGSSLGGLVTLAIGILYPHAFRQLMVMSPSIWWDDFAIYRLVDSIEQKPPLKIWLDTGTAEPGWEQARELLNRLIEKGWKFQKDLQYMEAQDAEHSEADWAARVEPALRFLFPPEK